MSANLETQQWPQVWKRLVFIPIPRRAMPKNIRIIIQLCSFHMVVRLCSKSFKQSFNSVWTNQELPDVQAGFRKKQRYQRSNCQHSLDHGERKGIPENLYFCFIDYAKDFDCVDYNRKIFKEMGIPDLLSYFLRNLRVKNQQLELDMKKWIGSKLGKD